MHCASRYCIAVGMIFAATSVTANPIVNLVGSARFKPAIKAKRVTGFGQPGSNAAADTAALNKTYPGQAARFRPTKLSTVTVPANGMVDKFGTVADLNKPVIGAYSYNYRADPDMTPAGIVLDLYIPEVGDGITSGMNTIGIALVDNLDRVKFWSFDDTTFSVGMNEFAFDFAAGAGAGGSTGFGEDLGFDLTMVFTLQVNQSAVLGTTFPPTPDTGETAAWKITTRLEVTPEPGVLAIAAAGAVAVLLRRRRHA